MSGWELKDLQYWDSRIREKVEEFGLECFPQEFEICDHHQMLGFMAYSGMPSRYPHWSFGKAYERLKTLYDHGVSGLPYEMVINSNPSLAYLMRDNSLGLQVLTMAHVYGHNDFFRNNFTFRTTEPEYTIERFKSHAARIRSYTEDPSIGAEKVEPILDAAHALSLQCRRNLATRKLSEAEQRQRLVEAARPPEDPYARIHPGHIYEEPDLQKTPLEPEEDILLFIRDHNPFLAEWEKDLLTIVHEESRYFLPQIETKIMNEGWASYWHHRILNSLDLPQELHLEFIVRHNQVLRPAPGQLNPYYVGFKILEDIRRRFDEPGSTGEGMRKLFEVRAADRDVSFLRRFLTKELMQELHLFEYKTRDDEIRVTRVSDEEHWKLVKETLLKTVGMGSVPVIRVVDADYLENRILFLRHDHDGRDLDLAQAEKTLAHLHRLWGRRVVLESRLNDKQVHLAYDANGFTKEIPLRGHGY